MTVTKKMFAWNVAGCMMNAASSFFMLAFVTRNTGLTDAGYFSIALATAQLLLTFGQYGVRAYQVTDIKNSVSRGSYLLHRAITVTGMMLLAVLFVLLSGYDAHKGRIVLYVCGMKAADAVEDVFHGELQKAGRLDTAGKLLAARNLLTLFLFAVLIFTGRNLEASCLLACAASLAACTAMNLAALRKNSRERACADISQVKMLFWECLPLSAARFLSIIIYNMPRYAVDAVESSRVQAVYSMLFMPSFAINLVGEFIFKPLLTPLSVYWEAGDGEAVKKILRELSAAAGAVSATVLAGGCLCGIPLLEWFYHAALPGCRLEFMILLLGGAFSAAVCLSYNLLTMMRRQDEISAGYFFGMALMAALAWPFVREKGMLGGACAYLTTEMAMAAYFCGCLKKEVGKIGKNRGK